MEKPLGISNLTAEERNFAILQLADWPSKTSVSNLFNLYHKYVSPQPSNQKCGACKSTIRTFWTNYLK